LAGVVLLVYVFSSKNGSRLIKAFKDDWFYFLIIGSFGLALMHITENFALKMTSTSETAIIMNSDPLLIAMLSYAFLKERVSKRKMLGLLIGYIGVTMVILKGNDLYSYMTSQTFTGNLLAFFSSCAWAVYTVMCKKKINKYGPVIFTTAASVFGAIVLGIFAFKLESVPNVFSLSANSILILLYLGIVVSLFNYLLWNFALKSYNASNIGSYWFLVPVIATIIGVWFFKEQLTASMVCGGGLIIIGIFLTNGWVFKKISFKKNRR
jgi:drug/metabolite transporter (DMT)-like permease